MSLYGGKKGLLQNSRNLCNSPQMAEVKLGARNGRKLELRLQIGSSCKKPKGKGGKKK